jgi:hypothetical protein
MNPPSVWRRFETWWLLGVLLITTLIETTHSAIFYFPDPMLERLGGLAFVVALAQWIRRDAQVRGFPLWYDFDAALLICAPLIFPVYIFCARGGRGFLFLLCVLGIFLYLFALMFAYSFALEEVVIARWG